MVSFPGIRRLIPYPQHQPFYLVGNLLKRFPQILNVGSVVMLARDGAVNVIRQQVGILENLQLPANADEGAAQTVDGDLQPGLRLQLCRHHPDVAGLVQALGPGQGREDVQQVDFKSSPSCIRNS